MVQLSLLNLKTLITKFSDLKYCDGTSTNRLTRNVKSDHDTLANSPGKLIWDGYYEFEVPMKY